jgi:hypothetical protein
MGTRRAGTHVDEALVNLAIEDDLLPQVCIGGILQDGGVLLHWSELVSGFNSMMARINKFSLCHDVAEYGQLEAFRYPARYTPNQPGDPNGQISLMMTTRTIALSGICETVASPCTQR